MGDLITLESRRVPARVIVAMPIRRGDYVHVFETGYSHYVMSLTSDGRPVVVIDSIYRPLHRHQFERMS